MSPFRLMTTYVSCLAKSFSVFNPSTLSRCTSVPQVTYINPVKYLTSQPSGPPKRPLNGFVRYLEQQRPVLTKHYPDIKPTEIISKVAQQWRIMSPEQKRPFVEAYLRAREQFTVDLKQYQALLTPAQMQQQAHEKRQRKAKREGISRKRELINFGKPKCPRTSFNIYVAEHFEEAAGAKPWEKFKSLHEDWMNLNGLQKQVYTQLAEDDKIRYKNEKTSWEDHMMEIGREDLIRKASTAEKGMKKAKTKAAKKTASGK